MEGSTTTALDTLMASATKLVEFSGTCLGVMLENPIYAFMFSGSIISVGLWVVCKLKNTARG